MFCNYRDGHKRATQYRKTNFKCKIMCSNYTYSKKHTHYYRLHIEELLSEENDELYISFCPPPVLARDTDDIVVVTQQHNMRNLNREFKKNVLKSKQIMKNIIALHTLCPMPWYGQDVAYYIYNFL